MNLSPFIRELILSNECVILRGVGGFETSYKHATINKQKNILLPPSKQIHFRGEWINDNGVLEDHLVSTLKITGEEASVMIDNFIQEFHNQIKKDGSAVLDKIGEFHLDTNQNLLFKELQDANYLADSFGLDILEIETKPVKKGEVTKDELSPIDQPKRKLTSLYISVGVLLLVISITLIILLSEGGDISLFNISKQNTGTAVDELVTFGDQKTNSEDSVLLSIQNTLDENTSPRTALAITNNTSQLPTETTTYYIVAGSLNSLRNAEVLKDQLIQKGFSADIITTESYVRVVIGSYKDRKKAIEELRRMRIQLDQSVWLLEQKP